MRFTDLDPHAARGSPCCSTAARVFFGTRPIPRSRSAIILALLFWTGLARIVRGLFLSLREKEFVEAAKAAGAERPAHHRAAHAPELRSARSSSPRRSIVAAAILVEAALSFLGFGIQPPNAALGKLIADGQGEGFELVVARHLPGLAIVLDRALRSTSSATACATRSTRRSGESVPEPDPLDPRPDSRVRRPRTASSSAVTDVSYDLQPGEVLGVVGESGSGKSVSMLSVLGLIPMPPAGSSAGEALLQGTRTC